MTFTAPPTTPVGSLHDGTRVLVSFEGTVYTGTVNGRGRTGFGASAQRWVGVDLDTPTVRTGPGFALPVDQEVTLESWVA